MPTPMFYSHDSRSGAADRGQRGEAAGVGAEGGAAGACSLLAKHSPPVLLARIFVGDAGAR